jgi:hypothetical protein
LPFFAFLVLFFAAFFLAGMVSVTSLLAGFVDSAGSCVLAWPPLEGRGLALPDSVDCLESLVSVDRFQKIWFPWDGIVSINHGAVLFFSEMNCIEARRYESRIFFLTSEVFSPVDRTPREGLARIRARIARGEIGELT